MALIQLELPKGVLVGCVFWVVASTVASSNSGLGLEVFLLFYVISALWAMSWLGRGLVHLWYARKAAAETTRVRYWMTEPVVWAMGVAIAISGVSSYARFALSRPALTSLACSTELVTDRDYDKWVGLYSVREVEVLPHGVVRLITSTSGLDEAGFVYSPKGLPPVVGEDFYRKLPLIEHWYHWRRSW